MTALRINHTRREYVTRPRDPDDRWDNDSTEALIYIHSITEVKKADYKDVDVSFSVEHGKDYYVLWADYDTGDSFGRYCNQLELIDVFQTYAAADKARKELEELGEECYSREYTRDDGAIISIHIPWAGYFESLNSINIDSVKLKVD